VGVEGIALTGGAVSAGCAVWAEEVVLSGMMEVELAKGKNIKKFGKSGFRSHICRAMTKQFINKVWWWHTNSERGK